MNFHHALNIPPTIGPIAGAEEPDTPPTDGESTKHRLSMHNQK